MGSLVGVAAVVAAGAYAGMAALRDSCTLNGAHQIDLGANSMLDAAGGSLLGAVPAPRWREPVGLAQMSQWVPKATVAVEDRRFWTHGALDYRSIVRAALADLRAGRIVQGGSTITEQLVRNLYIGTSKPTSFEGKMDEACMALNLAAVWPKQRILQGYLNQVYYGNHAYGIEAAAETYFRRPAASLTLTQAALLAGLPQAPSEYDPFLHRRAAKARYREVLAAMLSVGDITLAQERWAASRPIHLRPGRVFTRIRWPDFFDYATAELARKYGAQRVQSGGLRVQTTLETRLQRAATEAIGAHLLQPTDPAAALVAIDPRTGAIRAMTSFVPGRRRPLQFDLPSQAHRQAGSAFKTFTLTTAVEEGIPLSSVWTGPPSLTITDRRCLNSNGFWQVHNYADEAAGTMTLEQAIAKSVNTIFAQVVVKVGPDRVAAVAHRMGIRSRLKPVCSITLGSQAVTPLDMTDGFATLADRGVHHRPFSVQSVRENGRLLMKHRRRGNRALPAEDAALVTRALQGVIEGGTGTAAAIGRPAAGKTGTAESFTDAWFCGYVPQLATCVWVGYPSAEIPMENVEGLPAVFGGSLPAEIWHDFMTMALANVPVVGFAAPAAQPAPRGPAASAASP